MHAQWIATEITIDVLGARCRTNPRSSAGSALRVDVIGLIGLPNAVSRTLVVQRLPLDPWPFDPERNVAPIEPYRAILVEGQRERMLPRR